MKVCPCGSDQRYLDCCGAFIEKKLKAPSPEALMRSRYSAFVEKKWDYIQKTMRPPALLRFNKKSIKKGEEQVFWLGLRILDSHIDPNDETMGYVEFEAIYQQAGKKYSLHEKSEFRSIEGVWYYVDGILMST